LLGLEQGCVEEAQDPLLVLVGLTGQVADVFDVLVQTEFGSDTWIAGRVPTYHYEFNDDAGRLRYPPPLDPFTTHGSELTYVVDLPDAVFQAPLTADQEQLADTIRTAWARFAATGSPSTKALFWPSVGTGTSRVMSLATPQSRLSTDYAGCHHLAFWAQG
jgi:para-nitrobenzyl esterase